MSARRDSILREMGLAPLWRSRAGSGTPLGEAWHEDAPPESVARDATPVPAPAAQAAKTSAPVPRRPAAPPRAVDPPVRAHEAVPDAAGASDPGRAARIARLEWDALEADMRACTACTLCQRRTQAVPGVGERRAQWMLVGEGPGAEEDQRGEPFVGAAGKLLDAMLAAIGLQRGQGVYIANTVKCRPPHNRTPEAGEIAACFPYLERQIALVQPRILIALGRPAAQALLKTEVSIGASRGRVFHYGDTPLVVTYHPAYLLRTPGDKGKAWEDLCFARRLLG